ncbi:MAG: YjjG family noncanonical pyrimidine nucleotidase, partial [Flavobacteriales bacterium]
LPAMKRYRHLFFDLDHTLWDFTANSRATLRELAEAYRLRDHGVADSDAFIGAYEAVNRALWAEHGAGRMPKEVLRVLRFRAALQRCGVLDNRLPEALSRAYLERCPRKTKLMPGAAELLDAVAGRYRLHIVTNGFDEVQRIKLRCSGIAARFEVVLSSERAGASKPDARIFLAAMRQAGAAPAESLMIGDSPEADMAGARAAGIDHAHYHAESEPDAMATYRVADHEALRRLLA